MSKEQQNIPALRFPEFSEEWKLIKIGEVGKVAMCKRVMKDETSATGDIPFYKIGTFGKEADSYITNELFQKYKHKYPYPNKGDILISASGTIGRTVVFDGIPAYYQDSNIVWMANNEQLVKNSFLAFCYFNIKWNTEDTTIARLYNNNLSNIRLFIPRPEEQQKIAAFLSEVDKKIEELEKNKQLFEKYKKGMMQKIFSQQIRFKDEQGNNYPDWEEKKLEDIATKESSNISAKSIENNKGNYNIYGASGILSKINCYHHDKSYISIVKDGAGVGRVFLCEPYSSVLGTMDTIKATNDNSLKFLYYILLNLDFDKYTTGSTIPHIYFKDYKKSKHLLPQPEEQTKIANFLSSIDDKINLIDTELKKAKIFKKGLLQKMFV